MNWASWAVWGFGATVVLTTILGLSQGVKITRLNILFMLGAIFTSDRDKAKWYGTFIHLLNGYLFSLIYVAAFHVWGSSWQHGAVIGFVHSMFVLAVALPAMPAIHPRMNSEYYVTNTMRSLEPPGFFALNYGMSTPVSIIAAHIVFGIILGTFYKA